MDSLPAVTPGALHISRKLVCHFQLRFFLKKVITACCYNIIKQKNPIYHIGTLGSDTVPSHRCRPNARHRCLPINENIYLHPSPLKLLSTKNLYRPLSDNPFNPSHMHQQKSVQEVQGISAWPFRRGNHFGVKCILTLLLYFIQYFIQTII